MNKEYKKCLRCGRKLKTDKAKQLGYGDICYEKVIKENKSPGLFKLKININ